MTAEISTPEAVVTDTSSNVTPADFSADTVTKEPETITETAEIENTPPEGADGEKLYAGKYKTIEELEKGYKEVEPYIQKVSEYENLIKQYQSQEPQIIDNNGNFTPEFERNFNLQVDNFEFSTYQNLSQGLETEAMGEVQQLLNSARKAYETGNKNAYNKAMNEVKEYFNPEIIEQIATQKGQMSSQKQLYYEQAVQNAKNERAGVVANEIMKIPELNSLINPDSENFSKPVFTVFRQLFDSYGTIDTELSTQALSAIKEAGVKEYLAKQAVENTRQNASIPQGVGTIQKGGSMPTAEQMRANPKLYADACEKYGMAEVDKIIMKG